MSIFTNKILKPAMVVGIATLSLAACKSDDEKAREVLSEALQSYGSVQDTTASTSDRLVALSDVETKLATIAGDFATTDVGLKLAGQEAFGVLDPKELPTIKTQLSELLAAENCADIPTVQCIFATMKTQNVLLPAPGDDPLATIWGVILSPEFTPEDFAASHAADQAAPFIGFASIISGNEDRGERFFQAHQPHEDPQVAMALSLTSTMSRTITTQSSGTVIEAAKSYLNNIEGRNNPAVTIAFGLLDGSIAPKEVDQLWEEASALGIELDFPDWLYENNLAANLGDAVYREEAQSGLENFRASKLDTGSLEKIARIALEEGRDLVKGEQLWFAAQHGFADNLISIAENLEGPITFRGEYSIAQGAMQLGFDGDRKTFDRIMALMPNPPKFAELGFAFGRALAGDQSGLEAVDAPENTLELARIMAGLSVREVYDALGYQIGKRLSQVGPTDLERASIYNFDFTTTPEKQFGAAFARDADTANAALIRALKAEQIDIQKLERVLRSIQNNEDRDFLMSSLENPSLSLKMAQVFRPKAYFYQQLLLDPIVQENTAEAAQFQK